MRFFELIRAFLNDWKGIEAGRLWLEACVQTAISWKIGVTVFRHIPFLGNNIARTSPRNPCVPKGNETCYSCAPFFFLFFFNYSFCGDNQGYRIFIRGFRFNEFIKCIERISRKKERNYARDKLDDNIYYYVLEHRLKSEKILVVAIRGKLSLHEDICIYGVYNYSIRGEFVMVHYVFFFLLQV